MSFARSVSLFSFCSHSEFQVPECFIPTGQASPLLWGSPEVSGCCPVTSATLGLSEWEALGTSARWTLGQHNGSWYWSALPGLAPDWSPGPRCTQRKWIQLSKNLRLSQKCSLPGPALVWRGGRTSERWETPHLGYISSPFCPRGFRVNRRKIRACWGLYPSSWTHAFVFRSLYPDGVNVFLLV